MQRAFFQKRTIVERIQMRVLLDYATGKHVYVLRTFKKCLRIALTWANLTTKNELTSCAFFVRRYICVGLWCWAILLSRRCDLCTQSDFVLAAVVFAIVTAWAFNWPWRQHRNKQWHLNWRRRRCETLFNLWHTRTSENVRIRACAFGVKRTGVYTCEQTGVVTSFFLRGYTDTDVTYTW